MAVQAPTVRERILLHLFEHRRSAKGYTVPLEVTQSGIAGAVGIRVHHVTQYIKPLISEALVEERTSHVVGTRRRRKAYSLSETGRLQAYALREDLNQEMIRVRDHEGVREATIGSVIRASDGRLTVVDILRESIHSDAVDLIHLEAPPETEFVQVLTEAPAVEGFVGRRRELDLLTSDAEIPRLFVIKGVAGIGKTSLAAKACEARMGTRNLFWHRVRPWDTVDSILSRISAFLAAMGRPGLRSVLRRGDAARAAKVFQKDLSGTRSLLVFDDCHEAGPEGSSFFGLLMDALAEASDVQALLLTRRALPFYSRREVVLRGLVEELELQGLESHDVAAYLSLHDLGGPALDIAQGLHGHPLFLELLRAHNPFSSARADVLQYLEEEVYDDLSDAERGMMKVASLYRVPVPREALFANTKWPLDVLLSLKNRSLLRSVREHRFEVHDAIRDFFVGLLTSTERGDLSAFAVKELTTLASDARRSQQFTQCSSYLSNALQLPMDTQEEAALWEMLGDVNRHIGDILGVSVAYRAASELALDEQTTSRAFRKLAFALIDWGDYRAAAVEVERGFRSLSEVRSVERGWLSLARSKVGVETSKFVEAKRDAHTASLIFQEFDDVRGQTEAFVQLSWFVYNRGMKEEDEPSGREYLERALELSGSLDDPELTFNIHDQMISLIGLETGDVDEAADHLAAIEAIPLARESMSVRARFLMARSWFYLTHEANFTAAIADINELIQVAKLTHYEAGLAQAKYNLAAVSLSQGDVDDARRGFEEAAEQCRRLGTFRMYGNTLLWAGRCSLMKGDLESFRKILRILEDPEMAESGLLPINRNIARALDGVIRGENSRSCELFEDALREAQVWPPGSWGFRFELPRVHLIYGIALRVMGMETEAKEHISIAREMLQEGNLLGQLAWADVEEARLAEGLERIVETSQS